MSLEQAVTTTEPSTSVYVNVNVNRTIGDATVSFSASAVDYSAALVMARALAGADNIARADTAIIADGSGTAEVAKIEKAKPKAEAKKPAAQSSGTTKESAASAAPSDTGASNGDTVTYDRVKAKILELSKDKGREPTIALMSRYGVTKGPDLKPEQFADFITDVDAILAGTYDPEASELA